MAVLIAARLKLITEGGSKAAIKTISINIKKPRRAWFLKSIAGLFQII